MQPPASSRFPSEPQSLFPHFDIRSEDEVKMPSMAATARSSHLVTAAEALMITSPATSAYLQTQRFTELEIPDNGAASQACPSCGTILVPGWNSTLTRSKRTRQDRLAGIKASGQLECTNCHAIHHLPSTIPKPTAPKAQKRTVAAIAPATAKSVQRPRENSPVPTTQTSRTPDPAGNPTAGIKRRVRNKKSSLQDMLATRRTGVGPTTQGFGLGLGDFMK